MTHPARARLTAGSELLKSVTASKSALEPDVAERLQEFALDVDAILAPRGWTILRDSDEAATLAQLSLTITRALREALKSAEAEFAAPLGPLADQGLRAALDGWLPPKTLVRRARTAQEAVAKANERAVLQIEVNAALRKQVQDKLEEMTKRAGYRVTLSSIAISWIADQLGVDRPTADNLDKLSLVLHQSMRDHVVSAAAARGVSVDQVLEDGVREFLDGSRVPELSGWNMQLDERPRGGGGVWQAASAEPSVPKERGRLTVHMDEDLLEGLRRRAQEMNEASPFPVFPGTIGLAILKDRLGEPAE
ncbi:hypothetical protein [Streptomyces pseudovenezuelae]|uniref:hypothetical protein n=1 Tax=Streptomyces pseudovenezuelae TaxID=67350 RepID=UPI0036ECD003